MASADGTLAVITNRGDVFGANVNAQNIDPVFKFGGGVRIGFNAHDRFMVPLSVQNNRILTVITNDGRAFGTHVLSNNALQPKPPFQFTGARIGFNAHDRFMVAIDNTLIVVTDNGSVFGASVVGQKIGPIFQFTGARIGFNAHDRFMVAIGAMLVVLTDDGSVFGASVDVDGQNIGPIFQFTGAKIGFNAHDRFMVALNGQPPTLVVVTDGSVFGANLTDSIGPVFKFTGAKIGFNVQDRFMVALEPVVIP